MAAEARGQPEGNDLDDSAERIAVAACCFDLRLHGGAGAGVEAAHGVSVDPCLILRSWQVLLGRPHCAERDHVTDDLGTQYLARQPPGYLAERDARRRLPGAGPLQDRPGVIL